MLNWLVAASKLHKHRETCCTAEWPFYSFLILWPSSRKCDTVVKKNGAVWICNFACKNARHAWPWWGGGVLPQFSRVIVVYVTNKGHIHRYICNPVKPHAIIIYLLCLIFDQVWDKKKGTFVQNINILKITPCHTLSLVLACIRRVVLGDS